MPSRPPSPIPVGGTTPETVPRVVFLPLGVTRMILALLRSETRASPLARKISPHGTSKSSAMTSPSFGFGTPVADGLGVGVAEPAELADVLGVAVDGGAAEVADGLVEPLGGVVFSGAELSGLQPTRAPRPRPAEADRSCRLVTTLSILPAIPVGVA